jgi:AcrR family transcriptional regulator
MAGESERTAQARLLDAALAVIADGGWGAATSRVVAARAGVDGALVDDTFGSIDALRRAAVGHALERELAGPLATALEAHEVLDGIAALASALTAEGIRSSGRRMLVAAMAQCLRDDVLRADVAQRLRTFRDALSARLAELQEGGVLRADADPAALAVALTALVDGLLLHLMADADLDIRSPAASLVAMLRPGEAIGTRTS